MLLYSFCFCEILALCVSWITYDHWYYTPYLVSWVLFGLLVLKCSSYAQVHELLQSECGDNRGTRGHIILMMYIYIYIYIYTIKLLPSLITLIQCSISCTIEWFNWIMLKIQPIFKYSEFHVNYFTIFSLITTLSTDVKKSLQCKSIFLSNVNWRHAWR